jgi:protein-L-isoaspartate(D-aspartate) O-methyltransferase
MQSPAAPPEPCVFAFRAAQERAIAEATMNVVEARNRMVDGQVRTADVTDLRILAAMLELPRERFVPPEQADLAYTDLDIPLSDAPGAAPRRLMRPRTLAKLIQAADVAATDRVLDVGCTTGYGAAVLARLAADVVALDEDRALTALAARALADCGFDNVTVMAGPLTGGVPPRAPYDVIVLEGACEVAPRALFDQLADRGRLVCVEGRGLSGRAMLYVASGGAVSGRSVFDAAAPLLPGFAAPPAFVF